MTTRYRITARVIRDGQPFTTEPEFGSSVDEAKARLWQWIHECGWAFVAWHDLFQIEEEPPTVTQIALRGHIADKMNEFTPGIVPGQQEFYHVAPDGTVSRWWLVPSATRPTAMILSSPITPLGIIPARAGMTATATPFHAIPERPPNDPPRRNLRPRQHV